MMTGLIGVVAGIEVELPVFPELPDLPVFPDDELEEELDELAPERVPSAGEADVPACSCATRMAMAAVNPVAARTDTRVRARSREWIFSLLSGVFGWATGDMWTEYLCTSAVRTPLSHHARIDTLARPAVGLL